MFSSCKMYFEYECGCNIIIDKFKNIHEYDLCTLHKNRIKVDVPTLITFNDLTLEYTELYDDSLFGIED